MFSTISRNAFILAAFAIICSACVALIFIFTQPKIMAQEQQARLNILNQLIPSDSYNNDIVASCFMVRSDEYLGRGESHRVFVARKDNRPISLMIESSTLLGYGGEIKLAVGINDKGQLTGVQIIHHTETPGLGDKIQPNKSDWLLSFIGKSYQPSNQQRWEVKKNGGDFDAFTGATITPRAVVLAVKDTLIYFSDNKFKLFNHEANCEDNQ